MFNKPNMLGKMYIGDPLTADPTDLTSFNWDITLVDKGTTDIKQNNNINREEFNVYGVLKALEKITGSKTAFEVTQLVTPNEDPLSWYSRLRKIGMTPEDSKKDISICVQAYADDAQTKLLDDAYICWQAEMSVDNSLDFGTAGQSREVTIEISETLPGHIITALTGEPAEPVTPVARIAPVVTMSSDVRTFNEVLDVANAEVTGGTPRFVVDGKEYAGDDALPVDNGISRVLIVNENDFAKTTQAFKLNRVETKLDVKQAVVRATKKETLGDIVSKMDITATENGDPVDVTFKIAGLTYTASDKLPVGTNVVEVSTNSTIEKVDYVEITVK